MAFVGGGGGGRGPADGEVADGVEGGVLAMHLQGEQAERGVQEEGENGKHEWQHF